MTPKRGTLEYAELFDARGRVIVPKAILALLDASADTQAKLDRDYAAQAELRRDYNALQCRQSPPQPCQTRTVQIPLPESMEMDAQEARDAALGATIRRLWESIPHGWRFAIIAGAGAVGVGDFPQPLPKRTSMTMMRATPGNRRRAGWHWCVLGSRLISGPRSPSATRRVNG